MEAYATVSDLAAGWKTLSEAEQAIAETLLLRASGQLAALLAKNGIEVDESDEVQAINLKTVTCNMVRRSMSSGGAEGLSSMSQQIGSTQASVQWSNPDGAFYLSKTDKESLGIAGRSAGRMIQAETYVDSEVTPWWT